MTFGQLEKGEKVRGKVVIVGKNIDDVEDNGSGHNVELRLVSATAGDPENGHRGLVGPASYLETCCLPISTADPDREMMYDVTFNLDDNHGIPGAVIVNNRRNTQFYLKSITIESFPGKGRICFDCNSWVYNADKYTYNRIFFANDPYLPNNTPKPLRAYRHEELRNLRCDVVNRKLEEWDRVYDYAFYNDLGNPDGCPTFARQVLGGSAAFPYPRRCKTGRPPTKTDLRTEEPSVLYSKFYVPRDEQIGKTKKENFLGKLANDFLQKLQADKKLTNNDFHTFKEVLDLYYTST